MVLRMFTLRQAFYFMSLEVGGKDLVFISGRANL